MMNVYFAGHVLLDVPAMPSKKPKQRLSLMQITAQNVERASIAFHQVPSFETTGLSKVPSRYWEFGYGGRS